MYDFIYDFVLSSKYPSIFFLMFTFPSETVMPVVGYAASFGHVSLPAAILAGTAGSTLGSILIYVIARYITQEVLFDFVRRYGRWLGISQKSMERAGRWFDRNAKATVFIGKFVPGVRTAVSLSAGFRHMRFGPYVACTLLGTGISSTLLGYIGYSAVARFDELGAVSANISAAALIGFMAAVLIFLVWRRRR